VFGWRLILSMAKGSPSIAAAAATRSAIAA
jgi:hypothetical protein